MYENHRELSKYVFWLKRRDIHLKISWEVIKRAQPIADGNTFSDTSKKFVWINLDFTVILKWNILKT